MVSFTTRKSLSESGLALRLLTKLVFGGSVLLSVVFFVGKGGTRGTVGPEMDLLGISIWNVTITGLSNVDEETCIPMRC